MKRTFVLLAAVAALATGMVFAQASHRARRAQALNLTDAQKAQAKTIFQQAREAAKPIRAQLKENRQALTQAAKAGKSDADLQRLATEQGRLRGQMVAIRTEAFAKFYSTLTPEQRTKADQMQQQFHQRSARFHSERKNG